MGFGHRKTGQREGPVAFGRVVASGGSVETGNTSDLMNRMVWSCFVVCVWGGGGGGGM